MEIGHLPGHFGYGLMLFDAEEITLTYKVTDTGHTHPLPDRHEEYITNGTLVTDHNDTWLQG